MNRRFLLAACMAVLPAFSQAPSQRTAAQRIVEQLKAAHPEITGLELAAEKPGQGCQTIAATEAKEIGEKCDNDEQTAWKTNKPFIEQEKDEWDATVPVRNAQRKVIATAGMDFKAEAGRTKASVERDAMMIAAELESRLSAEKDWYRPAP